MQILFTYPNATTWVLPHHLWHMDRGFEPDTLTTVVKLFCCIDLVVPGGGGTLALAGSHRLVERYSSDLSREHRPGNSTTWRRFLRHDPWLDDLARPGQEPQRTQRLTGGAHDADGIDLHIVEMTGEPGDVYIIDLRTFHCVAPNASARPRMMVTAIANRAQQQGDAPT